MPCVAVNLWPGTLIIGISGSRSPCNTEVVFVTKYLYIKSTTVHVPSSELGLSQPLSLASKGAPPPTTGEGGTTRLLVRGRGSPYSDDWRKSLALYLLCGLCTQRKLAPLSHHYSPAPLQLSQANTHTHTQIIWEAPIRELVWVSAALPVECLFFYRN
jgi:hypothetical protein